jgi:hypothetical protein
MPYCPNCRFEYHAGVRRCPDCGEDLLPGTPPPPAQAPLPPPDTESALLSRVGDPTEAEIIRAALAEAGIPALVRRHGPLTGELAAVADGVTHDYALILVPRNRLAEAQRVLAELRSAPFEWPEGMQPDDSSEENGQAEE